MKHGKVLSFEIPVSFDATDSDLDFEEGNVILLL